jgi:hypothetical protein
MVMRAEFLALVECRFSESLEAGRREAGPRST